MKSWAWLLNRCDLADGGGGTSFQFLSWNWDRRGTSPGPQLVSETSRPFDSLAITVCDAVRLASPACDWHPWVVVEEVTSGSELLALLSSGRWPSQPDSGASMTSMRVPLSILLILVSVLASAQDKTTPQPQTARQYIGEELTLRGFYKGKTLAYDADGVLTEQAKSGHWDSDGLVVVEQVELKGDRVEFRCARLKPGFPGKRIVYSLNESRSLVITVATESGEEARLQRALDRIFIRRDEDFLSLVAPKERPLAEAWRNANPVKPGDSSRVNPPRLLHQETPSLGENGTVVLSIMVQTDGTPRVLGVVRGLSGKADEAAINAIEKWRFRPAMKDGQPIEARIQVEVNSRDH